MTTTKSVAAVPVVGTVTNVSVPFKASPQSIFLNPGNTVINPTGNTLLRFQFLQFKIVLQFSFNVQLKVHIFFWEDVMEHGTLAGES